MADIKKILSQRKPPQKGNLNLHDDAVGENDWKTLQEKGIKLMWLNANQIKPDPDQPRKLFKEQELIDLFSDIKLNGQIHPVAVKNKDINDGLYQLIVGEKRWRAISLSENNLPVLAYIKPDNESLTPFKTKLIQIAENVKRSSMTIIEEANGYLDLTRMDEGKKLSQTEIAAMLGISRPRFVKFLSIANCEELKSFCNENDISSDVEALYSLSTIIQAQPDFLKDENVVNEIKNTNNLRETLSTFKSNLNNEEEVPPQKTKENGNIKDVKSLSITSNENGEFILKINKTRFKLDLSVLSELNKLIGEFH